MKPEPERAARLVAQFGLLFCCRLGGGYMELQQVWQGNPCRPVPIRAALPAPALLGIAGPVGVR